MKYLILTSLLFISACSFKPSGLNQINGDFIYYDFISEKKEVCEISKSCNGDFFVYRLKYDNRALLVEIPVEAMVKSNFDKRKDIPFQGNFHAEVIFDKLNRVDFLKILEMNNSSINLIVKAKDVN